MPTLITIMTVYFLGIILGLIGMGYFYDRIIEETSPSDSLWVIRQRDEKIAWIYVNVLFWPITIWLWLLRVVPLLIVVPLKFGIFLRNLTRK